MSGENLKPQRNSSWSGTLLRVVLICGGSVAILLPAWLPNRPSVPIERGTVERDAAQRRGEGLDGWRGQAAHRHAMVASVSHKNSMLGGGQPARRFELPHSRPSAAKRPYKGAV